MLEDDMILYLKGSKDSTRKFLDLIFTFSKVAECKININSKFTEKSEFFPEKSQESNPIHSILKKMPRHKLNQRY
jgi:hypothetical protein